MVTQDQEQSKDTQSYLILFWKCYPEINEARDTKIEKLFKSVIIFR